MAEILHEIPIYSEPTRLYEMLTDERLLSDWWLPGAKIKAVEGAIGTFPLSDGTNQITMRVCELIPNRKVVWQCLSHKFPEWKDTKISFEILGDAQDLTLRFRHSDWKDSSGVFGKTSFYWSSLYLLNLKRSLEKPQQSVESKIVLYGRPYNRTDRVQWTLEELEIPYEYKKLDVFGLEHRRPEFKSKYGLTRLPFIEFNGKVLFESGAIMLILAETFRSKKDLLPHVNTEDYRYVLQWLFFALSTLESSIEELGSGAEPQPFTPLVDTLKFLDKSIEGKEFVASGRFTIADIALVNGLKWFDGEMVSKFSNVKRYYDVHVRRAPYQKILLQAEYPKGRS